MKNVKLFVLTLLKTVIGFIPVFVTMHYCFGLPYVGQLWYLIIALTWYYFIYSKIATRFINTNKTLNRLFYE